MVTLDIGSSSARTLLFSVDGAQIEGFGSRITYHAETTHDGGWQLDSEKLLAAAAQTLSEICTQLRAASIRPAAVGVDTFWHNILGLDAEGKPSTALLHVFDTRSAPQAKKLIARIDNHAQHQRTGAMLHPSFIPAKLLWLDETQHDAFTRTRRWTSFGEYLFLRLFGKAVESTSMVSGSGLWNQTRNDYDEEIMEVLPVTRDQFAPPGEMDQPQKQLLPAYAQQWPELNGIPWFPALADGACDNAGSGCTNPGRFALMVGTSGAMRVAIEAETTMLPDGLFCYRIDRKRLVLGGALSNGGEVYAWMKRTLQLPAEDELERQIAALAPMQHGLTMLPLFAGERSTKWRPRARAAITGLDSKTTPVEIVRAALESVALRFRNVYDLMRKAAGEPREIIASGGALLHSPAWTRIMADALGHGVTMCLEPEATSRGAALLALERLGAISNIRDLAPKLGQTIAPDGKATEIYERAREEQRRLYTSLFEEKH